MKRPPEAHLAPEGLAYFRKPNRPSLIAGDLLPGDTPPPQFNLFSILIIVERYRCREGVVKTKTVWYPVPDGKLVEVSPLMWFV